MLVKSTFTHITPLILNYRDFKASMSRIDCIFTLSLCLILQSLSLDKLNFEDEVDK